MRPVVQPLPHSERIVTLDVMRGFALLGILVVNMAFFANPVSAPHTPGTPHGVDGILAWLVAFLAQGKFYPLFAMLFGVGFALQLERAGTTVYLRRLVVLLVFGVLHGVFIWAGDILTAYALLGLLLLLVGRAETPTLILLAVIVALVQLALALLMLASVSYAEPCLGGFPVAHCDDPGTMAMIENMQAQQQSAAELASRAGEAYRHGGYLEITGARAEEYLAMLGNLAFFAAQILFMFLVGTLLGRAGVFERVDLHQRLLRSLLIIGIVIGLPLSAWFANLHAGAGYSDFLAVDFAKGFLVNIVAGPLMALAFAAAIALALRAATGKALEVLAPVGRLALSNYLLQSVFCTLLFYGYGFGLMREQPSLALQLAIALVLFVLQVVASRWWLRRFHYGPAEWVWRAATYGTLPRFRRRI